MPIDSPQARIGILKIYRKSQFHDSRKMRSKLEKRILDLEYFRVAV